MTKLISITTEKRLALIQSRTVIKMESINFVSMPVGSMFCVNICYPRSTFDACLNEFVIIFHKRANDLHTGLHWCTRVEVQGLVPRSYTIPASVSDYRLFCVNDCNLRHTSMCHDLLWEHVYMTRK